jgi:hypothetical protein
MMYWNPSSDNTISWTPSRGWNVTFSEQDKLQLTNLFFFFKNKKGFKENVADNMAHMLLFKQKYPGLKYSDEQERVLLNAVMPTVS